MSSSNERESVSDRLAILNFYLISALASVTSFTMAIALIAQIFLPVKSQVDPEFLIFGLTNVLACFLQPPTGQKKKEPDAVAIAERGGLVRQEVNPPENS